jgi:hypothetical protein
MQKGKQLNALTRTIRACLHVSYRRPFVFALQRGASLNPHPPAENAAKVDPAAIIVWLFIGLSTPNQYFLMMGLEGSYGVFLLELELR